METKGLKTTIESFQMRYCMQIYLRVSKLPEVKDLNFQIYLIKIDFFGNSKFDFW